MPLGTWHHISKRRPRHTSSAKEGKSHARTQWLKAPCVCVLQIPVSWPSRRSSNKSLHDNETFQNDLWLFMSINRASVRSFSMLGDFTHERRLGLPPCLSTVRSRCGPMDLRSSRTRNGKVDKRKQLTRKTMDSQGLVELAASDSHHFRDVALAIT